MNIKYAGPRPEISQHGIQFKDGKEDKYVYLIIAVQILKAIDKNYDEKSFYTYDTSTKRFSDEEILNILLSYEPTLKDDVVKEELRYEQHLEDEIDTVRNRTELKDIERTAWINNLNIMKSYKIQRAINKIYYMHCVKNISQIIKREKIKEIDTPFYEKYWHVLQTIQGSLSEGRDSVGSNLEIDTKSSSMTAKLFINY